MILRDDLTLVETTNDVSNCADFWKVTQVVEGASLLNWQYVIAT